MILDNMIGWVYSLLFVTMLLEIFSNAVTAFGQSSKKKVSLINEEEVLSPIKTYSLEDFFWTGSGDGPLPPPEKSGHSTIVRTTTVLATVFIDTPSSLTTDIPRSDEDCFTECPINPPAGEIDPTRVNDNENWDFSRDSLPDPKYWLLTVLRTPATPLPPALSRSLARLYQKAFLRQQEQHLGIIPNNTAVNRKKHQTNIKMYNTNDSVYNSSITNNFQEQITGIFKNDTDYNYTFKNFINDIELIHPIINNENDSTELKKYINYNISGEIIFGNTTILNITDKDLLKFQGTNHLLDSTQNDSNITYNKNYNYSMNRISNSTLNKVKREIYNDIDQPRVEVFLHNLTKSKSGLNDEIKVVYWVSVGGRPVPARTAARDMKLIADSEVVAELGYPVSTKAEPYLNLPEQTNGIIQASNSKDIWIIISATVLSVFILLSLVVILACRLINKRKSSASSRVLNKDTINQHYPINMSGKDNASFLKDDKENQLMSVISGEKKKNEELLKHNNEDYKRILNYPEERISSPNSTSSSSELSQITTTLRQKQRLFEKQLQNEYSIVNKRNKSKHKRIRSKKVGVTNDSLENLKKIDMRKSDQFVLSSPSSRSNSSCESVILRRPQGIISPTSYLSMPSVKSFPRGNAVEPLSRVLEPLSVKHLDMDSDSPIQANLKQSKYQQNKNEDHIHNNEINNTYKCSNYEDKLNLSANLIRMGSIDKDPGVIGPIVWDLHKQRIEKDSQESDVIESMSGTNISKMRQRFTELVDDAFSLFGSVHSTSTVEGNNQESQNVNVSEENNKLNLINTTNVQNRRHSAKDGCLDQTTEKCIDRPRTALPPRPPLPCQHNMNPTTAWGSNNSTPMVRAYSASGIRRPVIDVALANSDTLYPSNDPAIPLIQAIRKELDKLPGTSDA